MVSEVLNGIPESYFGKTMGRKLEVGAKPLINLAVGIPDKPAPEAVLKEMSEAILRPENNKYGVFRGKETFKNAIQKFYKDVYQVDINHDEICILYGTKSGLVHLPTCIVEPGEGVMLPDPGYTDYLAGVHLARAKHYVLPLQPEHHYLPQWDQLNQDELGNTRLIYLNYPSNPTGAVATRTFFDDTVKRFINTKTKIVHDFAYAAFGFEQENLSILQSPGAKDVAIEIYSLSKGFNMSGFRVGFAVGNKEMIESLNRYQDHTQVGMWGALQDASIAALSLGAPFLEAQNELFKARRNKVVTRLEKIGLPFEPLQGGIFLWLKVPPEFKSEAYVDFLLKSESILVTPGIPFGKNGDDYVRVSLAVDDALLDEFLDRIENTKVLYEV